jgi:hypothetical protein
MLRKIYLRVIPQRLLRQSWCWLLVVPWGMVLQAAFVQLLGTALLLSGCLLKMSQQKKGLAHRVFIPTKHLTKKRQRQALFQ